MTTINAGMSNSVGWVPLTEADALTVEPGFYTVDSENIEIQGLHRTRPDLTQSPFNGRWVQRGVAGSTAASHTSSTAVTRYFPDAPGGPGGGGVTVTGSQGGSVTSMVVPESTVITGVSTLPPSPGTGVLVYLSDFQSTAVNNAQPVSWAAAQYDDGDYFDPLTPLVLTIPVDGVYRVEGYANGDANDGDEVNAGVNLQLVVNGGAEAVSFVPYNAYQSTFAFWAMDTLRLHEGDEVAMQAELDCESGGSTWRLRGSDPAQGTTTRLRITYLGPLP